MKSDEVAEYLQDHPQFFEEHTDLGLGVVLALRAELRAALEARREERDKNRETESKLAELISFGEENDQISEKVHRLAVGLIAVETSSALIHLLRFHLRDDFLVPHVALRLWKRPEGVNDLPEFAAVAEELQVFAETLTHPYCGSTAGFGTTAWFGEQAGHLRSQALIALCDGGTTIGMLALGSEDAKRFYPEMGTLYLERIGEMVSAALIRVAQSAQ